MRAPRLAVVVSIAAAVTLTTGLTAGLGNLSLREGAGTPTSTAVPASLRVRVTAVLDGDTVRAQTPEGRDLGRVRLLGIDAPEIAHGTDPGECYGETARELLAGLLPPGTTVDLVGDPRQPDRDVYGRLLRYVDLHGMDLSETLLTAGAAHLYASEPPLTRAADNEQAVAEARRHARGLWGTC